MVIAESQWELDIITLDELLEKLKLAFFLGKNSILFFLFWYQKHVEWLPLPNHCHWNEKLFSENNTRVGTSGKVAIRYSHSYKA
jgi:hypothetical protein